MTFELDRISELWPSDNYNLRRYQLLERGSWLQNHQEFLHDAGCRKIFIIKL